MKEGVAMSVKTNGISALTLKLIAMVTMLVDHSAVLFFHSNPYLRFAGRIAFPLYAFMAAEGWYHTRHHIRHTGKYVFTLLVLALISEPIYDISLYPGSGMWTHNNVIFTLLIALLGLTLYDHLPLPNWLRIPLIVLFAAIAAPTHTSYGTGGVLLVYGFAAYRILKERNHRAADAVPAVLLLMFAIWMFSKNIRTAITVSYLIRRFTYSGWRQFGVLLAAVPIAFYNGKEGRMSSWFRTLYRHFYPLHLAVLYMLGSI